MPNKEPLINPMSFYGPGACPICFTPLILAEREITVMDLDSNGNVTDISATQVTAKAYCPRCGNKQNMMRSKGIYRPYSETVAILDKFDLDYEVNNRIEEGKNHLNINPLSLND